MIKTESEKIYLYGTGGHARVIHEMVGLQGGAVAAFVDDNPDIRQCQGLPVLHTAAGLSPMIVAIGSNSIRKRIAESLDCTFATAVHPSAIVSPTASIGEGTVIMPGAIVNAGARIGRHCIINTGASVGHDCSLGDFCHVAPHATLCGTVHLGEGVWVGAGAVVNQNMEIGEWTVVGSGAAVVDPVGACVTVTGVPSRSMTLTDKIYASSRKYGDSVAVTDGKEDISYRQLRIRSNAIAHLLSGQDGKFAALLLPRSCWFTVSALGVIKSGKAFLPLNGSNPVDYNLGILSEVPVSAIITTSQLWEIYEKHLGGKVLPILVDRIDRNACPITDIDYSEASGAAALYFTSGSTGYRKGVVHSLRSLTFLCERNYLSANGNMPEKPVFSVLLDLCFMASFDDLFVPLMHGGTSYIVPEESLKEMSVLPALLAAKKVCHVTVIGPMVSLLAKNWTGNRLIIASTGERMPSGQTSLPETVEIVNFYGMSECGSCFYHKVAAGEQTVPMGRSVAGVHAFVLDENRNPLPEGETGELYLHTPGLAMEYYGNTQLTKESFLNIPSVYDGVLFRTGDRVRVLPDGNWLYCGRTDHTVKVRGFRMNTGDIENVALECPQVERAAVVLQSSERLALFYEGTAREEELRDWLSIRLPEYMCPQIITRRSRLPQGERGKTDVPALPDLSSWSETEIRLAAAFEKILDMPVRDRDCDFFRSGGDSLAVMKLVCEMDEYTLDAKTVYSGRTLQRIAGAMASKTFAERLPEAKRIGLSAFQQRVAFTQRAFPERAMWNNVLLYRLGKGVDRKRLAEALSCAVNHHPMLSARLLSDADGTFSLERGETDKGHPVVHEVSLEVDEMEGIPEALVRPFDLTSGEPLYRIFIADALGKAWLLLDFHHLISDGCSIKVFMENVFRAYGHQPLPEDCYWEYASGVPPIHGQGLHALCDAPLPYFNETFTTALSADDIKRAERYWHCSVNVLAVVASLKAIAGSGNERTLCVNWLYSGRDKAILKNAFGVLVHFYTVRMERDFVRKVSPKELMVEAERQMQESILHPETDYYCQQDADGNAYPLLINNMIHFAACSGNAPFEMEKTDYSYTQTEPLPYFDVELYLLNGRLAYRLVGAGTGAVHMPVSDFNLNFGSIFQKLLRTEE